MIREGKPVLSPEEIKEKLRLKKEFDKLALSDKMRIYTLVVKYWAAGDDWDFAKEYALSLIKGWKKNEKRGL